MAFTSWEVPNTVTFNSKNSADFLDFYNEHLEDEYRADRSRPAHRTFAPSSFRCSRLSWFRLKGIEPDKTSSIDKTLEFKAEEGTAIHRIIQSRLVKYLGDDWMSVKVWLNSKPRDYEYNVTGGDPEYQVQVINPPVRFAVDGLICWNDTPTLLEIKTSEYAAFQKLIEPKPQHIDQVKFYSTILGVDQVLFLYVDRQYGDMKSFEVKVSQTDKDNILKKIDHVMQYVDWNICPERLPDNDPWCNPSMCKYYNKCKQY